MQIEGDVGKLTSAIEDSFAQKLEDVKAKLEQELAAAKKENQLAQQNSKTAFELRFKKESELLVKKEASIAICDVREQYDREKQILLEKVMDEIKQEKTATQTAEYKNALATAIEDVSAADAKKATLIVSEKSLVPKGFRGKVETTKEFIGVKLIIGSTTIDLSLDTLVQIQKEKISVLLHDKLFA